MKHYSATGRRNHGRPLKRLLDTWDRNGSTSGPTAWRIYDDDDDDELHNYMEEKYFTLKLNGAVHDACHAILGEQQQQKQYAHPV